MLEMIKKIFLLLILSVTFIYADVKEDGCFLAKKLSLNAASKAIIQWERVFRSDRKMKRYKIDTLSTKEREMLKKYLINHAIDSDHPTVAGV